MPTSARYEIVTKSPQNIGKWHILPGAMYQNRPLSLLKVIIFYSLGAACVPPLLVFSSIFLEWHIGHSLHMYLETTPFLAFPWRGRCQRAFRLLTDEVASSRPIAVQGRTAAAGACPRPTVPLFRKGELVCRPRFLPWGGHSNLQKFPAKIRGERTSSIDFQPLVWYSILV